MAVKPNPFQRQPRIPGAPFLRVLRARVGFHSSRTPNAVDLLKNDRGSALLEFAISLPLLIVFVVGIFDFSGAFNQKQKLEQAAQEAAIIAGSQPMSDIQSIPSSNPASLQAVVLAVENSLTGSNVLTGTCGTPTTPGPAGLTWIYTIPGCNGAYSGDSLVVTINRGLVTSSTTTGGTQAVCTVVTVQYPYHWRFNNVIQLLVPGASYAATTQESETATVHNQT